MTGESHHDRQRVPPILAGNWLPAVPIVQVVPFVIPRRQVDVLDAAAPVAGYLLRSLTRPSRAVPFPGASMCWPIRIDR